jgi:cytoskeletal protein CcmA (bactofilin family)
MGIFSKQSRAKSQQSVTTVIAKGCSISGQLKLESDIQIDGTIEGQIEAAKTLIISRSGMVSGEVHASRVLINGDFEGTCYADQIEILSCGRVTGTIYSDNLSIEQGGKFNGITHAAEVRQEVLQDKSKLEQVPKKSSKSRCQKPSQQEADMDQQVIDLVMQKQQ